MYKRNVNILLFIIILISYSCINNDHRKSKIENNNVKTASKKLVFDDNTLDKWNESSLDYLNFKFHETSDSCFLIKHKYFLLGDCNIRKHFVNQINKDSLLSKDDFLRGFYIVEIETCGSTVNQYMFVIKNTKIDNCSLFRFFFDNNGIWRMVENISLIFETMDAFFDQLSTSNLILNDDYPGYGVQRFIITKFSNNSINLYIGYCKEFTPVYEKFVILAKSKYFEPYLGSRQHFPENP